MFSELPAATSQEVHSKQYGGHYQNCSVCDHWYGPRKLKKQFAIVPSPWVTGRCALESCKAECGSKSATATCSQWRLSTALAY